MFGLRFTATPLPDDPPPSRGWRTHRPAIRIKPSLQASNDAYLMGYIDRQTGGGAPRPDYLELVHLQQRASKTWSRSQDELPVCKDAKQWKYLNFEYIRKHGTPDCHEVEIELWQFTLLFSICGIWYPKASRRRYIQSGVIILLLVWELLFAILFYVYNPGTPPNQAQR